MDERLLKPISEASYLTADNAGRYRAILRYFYKRHERMQHFLYPEEVYEHLRQFEHFSQYTIEMLEHDLNQLVKWKNLYARQETSNVKTIEEFKKKRFRYQCSPYTVEIERMVMSLENMGEGFGGSLEKTLFDRLYESLRKLSETGKNADSNLTDEEWHRIWTDIYDYFTKIVQNSTDYIAYLSSENIEDRMMTEAFLTYKDHFTQYLRDFIISLQQTSLQIESVISGLPSKTIQHVAKREADYQASIPRLDQQTLTAEEIQQSVQEQWDNLKEWFLGKDGRPSELERLQNSTNETIRRMTRFVQRLGERHQHFRSRKKDYLHLADWFAHLTDINEAHCLSSLVFGVSHSRHIYAEEKRTENIYSDIWDEEPSELIIKPRVRQYREKTKPTAIQNHKLEKIAALNDYMEQKEAEQRMIEQYIDQNTITFKSLPVIEPQVRKVLLSWVGKAMAKKDRTIKVESGRVLTVGLIDETLIRLESKDGVLHMPNFQIQFLPQEDDDGKRHKNLR
ncbi:TIGR02677 family protein [Siminovitchia fortis]|uniref:TIGR02677 family protein n=1 Tax=Siminovitchia fortis TaxID=254758 RepID=UPI0011A6EF02|nr:TIGR02677 family protein [Siminovitchia fortis]